VKWTDRSRVPSNLALELTRTRLPANFAPPWARSSTPGRYPDWP